MSRSAFRTNSDDPRQIAKSVVKITVRIRNIIQNKFIINNSKIYCGMAEQDVHCVGKYKDKEFRDTFSIRGKKSHRNSSLS